MKTASSLLLKLFGLFIVLLCWHYASRHRFSLLWSVVIVWGFVALVPLFAYAARRMLEGNPNAQRAAELSMLLHYCLMVLLGCALIVAFRLMKTAPILSFSPPEAVFRPLMMLFGVLASLTILNLLAKGLGLPFAAVQSSKLVDDWLYKHSRNPMGLFSLLFVLAAAFWLGSLHAVLWALLWLTPAWVLFVKIYEERELEVRFGKSYREYKAKTPFFL